MAKNTPKAPSLVSWREDASSRNVRGIITAHVRTPHFIEIDPRGGWVLLTLDKKDKPQFVARGQARNVATAQAAVTAAAIAKVPELKAAIMPTEATQNEPKQRVYLISARRATARVYLATAALILWALWGLYWLFVVRPKVAVLAVLLLVGSLYAAHAALRWLKDANTTREKLAKQQEARALVKVHQQRQAS